MREPQAGRRYLPWRLWPEGDRQAWEAALAEGDILDGQGPGAHWARATRKSNRQHYARWLCFLDRHGLLEAGADPATRVTLETVRRYVDELQREVAPRTVVSSLVGLKEVLKVIAPAFDRRWLADVCNALNRTSRPVVDRASRIRPAGEIHVAAMAELDRLRQGPLCSRIDRVACRDTLMLAMLAARPVRLRNFAGLRLGHELRHEGPHWLIVIAASDTKTRRAIEHILPAVLYGHLEHYLAAVRPSFHGRHADGNDRLWLGFEGQPLTAHSIYGRITMVSERLLGAPLNPHLLRACAASSLALDTLDGSRAAQALLGHQHLGTTERHYLHLDPREATRRVGAALARLSKSAA